MSIQCHIIPEAVKDQFCCLSIAREYARFHQGKFRSLIASNRRWMMSWECILTLPPYRSADIPVGHSCPQQRASCKRAPKRSGVVVRELLRTGMSDRNVRAPVAV